MRFLEPDVFELAASSGRASEAPLAGISRIVDQKEDNLEGAGRLMKSRSAAAESAIVALPPSNARWGRRPIRLRR
jgi:hypothetical protein